MKHIFIIIIITIQLSSMMQCQFGDCNTDFSFFYFKQQWPGSQCNTKRGCCYPITGKPKANFLIHGLHPIKYRQYNPIYCDPHDVLSIYKIDNIIESLRQHWPPLNCPSNDEISNAKRNWAKFGTCSNLNQHIYFKTTLQLKNRLKLLEILDGAEIKPNNGSYSIDYIRAVISKEVGFAPIIFCNVDVNGQSQLHEIQFCVRKNGVNLKNCPEYKSKSKPNNGCEEHVKFPSF